ncbi:MAG: hypothetical protein KDC87_08815 [Planctomycetes bacterium]|nr:hypothetical protein [Planctomycetota bacterium]
MTIHPEHGTRRPLPHAVWLGLALFFTFLLYVPALQNDFAWDDKQAAKAVDQFGRNPNVAELHGLTYYYTTGYWPNKDPGSPNYRPLTVLSFGLGHALCGDSAALAHLLTLLAHLLATALVYPLLRSLGANAMPAVLGVLVFGAHALHSEAVASVVGRAESLAFACGVVCTLSVRRAARAGDGARLGWLALAALSLFAACSFKESGIAWAAFAPLGLWLCPVAGARLGRAGTALLAVAMLVPSALFVAVRQAFLAGVPPTAMGYFENPHLYTDATTRVLSSLVVWGYGLLVTALPFRLAVDHGITQFPIVESLTNPWTVCVALTVAAFATLLLFGWRTRQKHPLLALGVGCFLGFTFLVSNTAFPVYLVFAERTYYTACLALPLLLCALAARLGPRPHPAWILVLGTWVGYSAHATFTRNAVWSDDIAMVEREVRDHPNCLRLLVAAGHIELRRGAHGNAREYFGRAATLDPQEPRAFLGLGKALFHLGAKQEAADVMRHALGLPPHRFHPRLRQDVVLLAARIHAVCGAVPEMCTALEESARADARFLGQAADLLRATESAAANESLDSALRTRLRAVLERVRAAAPAR